ncbi:hypothetical protein ACFYMW_39975 [Streptomyces sp. NPDC006692]|uniref:hypothetical protein n=1 Tax=unclassified Streptomyces TaxID=2593676 RepID=UPI003694C6E6
MTLRTPIGTAHALASDGSVTRYTVHAADAEVLYVTRGDADAGAWAILSATPAPIRRDQFHRISLHTDPEQIGRPELRAEPTQ